MLTDEFTLFVIAVKKRLLFTGALNLHMKLKSDFF